MCVVFSCKTSRAIHFELLTWASQNEKSSVVGPQHGGDRVRFGPSQPGSRHVFSTGTATGGIPLVPPLRIGEGAVTHQSSSEPDPLRVPRAAGSTRKGKVTWSWDVLGMGCPPAALAKSSKQLPNHGTCRPCRRTAYSGVDNLQSFPRWPPPRHKKNTQRKSHSHTTAVSDGSQAESRVKKSYDLKTGLKPLSIFKPFVRPSIISRFIPLEHPLDPSARRFSASRVVTRHLEGLWQLECHGYESVYRPRQSCGISALRKWGEGGRVEKMRQPSKGRKVGGSELIRSTVEAEGCFLLQGIHYQSTKGFSAGEQHWQTQGGHQECGRLINFNM